MRISDWSSDVCSSDLGLVRCIAVCRQGRGCWPARSQWSGQNYLLLFHHGSCEARFGAHLAGRRRHYAAAHVPQSHSGRSEEHTSELQSLMRISYAVFCLKKKKQTKKVESYIRTQHKT